MKTLTTGGVAALVLIASLGAQQVHRIGKLGGRLELDDSWRRQEIDEDDVADQFNGSRSGFFRSRECHVSVREVPGVLENETDYRLVMDRLLGWGHGEPIAVVAENGRVRATRRFDVDADGRRYACRVELLVTRGLAYQIVGWSPRSDGEFLDERTAEVVEGLQFPAPQAAWRAGLQPERVEVASGAMRLSLEAADALFEPAELLQTELLRLRSRDGEQVLSIFGVARARAALGLQAELRALQSFDATVREVVREPFDLDGAEATLLVSASATHTAHSVQVVVDGQTVVVRYWAPGGPNDARPVRDALLRSLRVTTHVVELLELPELPPAPAVPSGRGARADALLARAETVAELPFEHVSVLARLDEEAFVIGNYESEFELRGGEVRRLRGRLGYAQAPELVRVGGRDHAIVEGELFVLDEGRVGGDAVCAAALAVGHGDKLFVVRVDDEPPLGVALDPGGITHLAGVRVALLERGADGGERVLTQLDGKPMTMAVSPDGRRLAAGIWWSTVLADQRPRRLCEIDVATGEVTSLGAWDSTRHVLPAGDGWLVTGQPAGEPQGIWLCRGAADHDALVTGADLLGVEVTDAALTLIVASGQGPAKLLRLSLADCRRDGRLCQPFASNALEAVADATFSERDLQPPRTLAELRAALQRADGAAQRLVGIGLPTTAVEMEAVLQQVGGYDCAPSEAARRLLAMLVARVTVDAGAEWVEASGSTRWSDWTTRTRLPRAAPVANIDSPANLILAALDDMKGYGIAAALEDDESVRGVPRLIGVDPVALQARLAELRPDGLDAAIRDGRTDDVAAHLDRAPDNIRLRADVYELLAARGWFESVEQLAARMVASGHHDVLDDVAAIGARFERNADAETAAALFSRTLELLAAHPRNATVTSLLARICERAFPDKPQKALQCYRRVLEVEHDGWLAVAARRAIERLGG